ERLARGCHRAVHVLRASLGGPGHDFLGVRIDDLELLPTRRRDPLAADVELVGMPDVHACGGHWGSPGFGLVKARGPHPTSARQQAAKPGYPSPTSGEGLLARLRSEERRVGQRYIV